MDFDKTVKVEEAVEEALAGNKEFQKAAKRFVGSSAKLTFDMFRSVSPAIAALENSDENAQEVFKCLLPKKRKRKEGPQCNDKSQDKPLENTQGPTVGVLLNIMNEDQRKRFGLIDEKLWTMSPEAAMQELMESEEYCTFTYECTEGDMAQTATWNQLTTCELQNFVAFVRICGTQYPTLLKALVAFCERYFLSTPYHLNFLFVQVRSSYQITQSQLKVNKI